MSRRVAVVGASGLVGATLVERLVENGRDEVVPLIHSSGSAWRLARLGLPLKQVDLFDRRALAAALAGCTHVVNCSRGDDSVMVRGLQNLLAAARDAKVRRFVHLSSVAVYGDPPPAASVSEDAPASPAKGSYGWIKLRQDELVARAAVSGLSAIALCPPNIGGPYSYYCIALVGLLRTREFGLLDNGALPCSVVDVANLAYAIDLALDRGPKNGMRLFITDAEPVTWRDVIGGLAPLAGMTIDRVPVVSREEIQRARPPDRPPISLVRGLKHLISIDVRRAMRKDPFWERIDDTLRSLVATLGTAAENRVRHSIQGPLRPGKTGSRFQYQTCAQQLRGVRHSSARARELIGYSPPYTFAQSIGAFSKWYYAHHGLDSAFADLIKELF